jgi:hypothetical protein
VVLEERRVGFDLGHRASSLENFNWLPFIPLWSPSPVLQLVSEPVWSLVGSNRFYDPNATWRNVQ